MYEDMDKILILTYEIDGIYISQKHFCFLMNSEATYKEGSYREFRVSLNQNLL